MALGWGLIGPGLHADKRILPAIKQSASSKLIGVCHYNKEKADFFAKRYEAKRGYTTLEEMLADPEIQVVDVATPETMHKEQVIKAAQAGKHVRCEFPMALTSDECKEMLVACDKAKVKLSTGFAWAQHPAHIEMKKRISNGSLGEIRFIEGQYNLPWGGGLIGDQTYWKIPIPPPVAHTQAWKRDPSYTRSNAVFHQGIVIFLFRYLLGQEVEELVAITDPTGENKSIACLKFDGGTFGYALGSHINPYGNRSLSVFGSEGRMTGIDTLAWSSTGEVQILKLKGDDLKTDMKGSGKKTTASDAHFEGQKQTEILDFCGANMWVDTIEAFNRSILEDSPVTPSGIDGLRERQITEAILKFSTLNNSIKIPEI